MIDPKHPPQQFKPLSFLPVVRSISEGQLADLRPLLANRRLRHPLNTPQP